MRSRRNAVSHCIDECVWHIQEFMIEKSFSEQRGIGSTCSMPNSPSFIVHISSLCDDDDNEEDRRSHSSTTSDLSPIESVSSLDSLIFIDCGDL